MTIVALLVGVAFAHVDAGVLLTLVAALGTLITALVGTGKAIEAADTASRNHQLSQLTASQNAAIQQQLAANCGAICSHADCPLRKLGTKNPPPLWGVEP